MTTGLVRAQQCLAIQLVRLCGSEISKTDALRPENVDSLVDRILGFQGVTQVGKANTTTEESSLWVYIFRYKVGVKVTPKDAESDSEDFEDLLEITAEFDAEYVSEKELDDADVSEFSEKNVGYHVWPYWREYVQSTISRMALPSSLITVPFYFAAESAKPVDQKEQPGNES